MLYNQLYLHSISSSGKLIVYIHKIFRETAIIGKIVLLLIFKLFHLLTYYHYNVFKYSISSSDHLSLS